MLRWIIFITIYILVDIYAFQALKTITKNQWFYAVYVAISLILLGMIIYQLNYGDSSRSMTPWRMYTLGLTLAIFFPKMIVVLVMFIEDLVRLVIGLVNKGVGFSDQIYLPSRRKFISAIAIGVAAIPFSSLMYGMFRGKYNYRVRQYTLEFDDLPEAFNGYRITQISDIHSGSFDNLNKVAEGIKLIREQASDMILFTGDLVNNRADEMLPYKELFGSLSAPDGVYSVLGNHDYGDYVNWGSSEEKEANLQALKTLCLLYTSPSPRDRQKSRMPSSA